MFEQQGQRLIFRYDDETLWLEPWGENSLRIRATKEAVMPENEDLSALLPVPYAAGCTVEAGLRQAQILNGAIRAEVTSSGKITIYCGSRKLLEEYVRNRRDITDPKCSALEIPAREFRSVPGGGWRVVQRFESLSPEEKLYGMGQYQQPWLDLKGLDLELAQRNSQASVPFLLSSLGYGLLWNNPAVGRAVLGKNVMSFVAERSRLLDYWVTAGDTPAQIEHAYAAAVGTVPMMPEYGLGFWQCKLRYQTQEELLGVAREYRRRGLPLDVIVIDFFHWTKQGEWKFDPQYWPDPAAMVRELRKMGVELMVSVWPTVDRTCENFAEMKEKGYLIHAERGADLSMGYRTATLHFDATNPGARRYVWEKIRQNYGSCGIHLFWLDETEPEYSVYDFDNYRYWLGPDLEVGNVYPRCYSRAFCEGQQQDGRTDIVNLVRCAWAGSQRYGALVWSGDIASSFHSMRCQLAAGLNMGLAGIPWWTTDIGGFHGGDPSDEAFRELFVRWFQWGAFCPVMRLHGDRLPPKPPMGETGRASCRSGADNEVWSYGEAVYAICRKYLVMRESMRDYLRGVMRATHETGDPVMRTLFYEFPKDPVCWQAEDEYLFGPRYLTAPVFTAGARSRRVYLPAGARWRDLSSGAERDGGCWLTADAPLDTMPVYERL